MAGEWGVGVAAATVGVLVGALLAALTRTLPGQGRLLVRRAWRGAGAGGGRIVAVTALAAVTTGLLGAAFGADPVLPAFFVLGLAGVVLAVVDVDCHRLPDRLVLPLYPVGVVLLSVAGLVGGDPGRVVTAVLCAVATLGVLGLLVLAVPSGLGRGDVKLAGLLSLHLGWFGWEAATFALLLGLLLGALAALALLAARRVSLHTPIAFGPALLAGWLVVALAEAVAAAG